MDDIQFLKENCSENSTLIYVDSSKRNLKNHPYPGEYTIQLAQPFKNVFGFDVLDGAIPNTMYNVDIYNNLLTITTIKPGSSVINTSDVTRYFHEVATSKTFIDAFNDNIHETFIIIGNVNQIEPRFAAPITLGTPDNYNLFMSRITMNNSGIMPYTNQSPDEFYVFNWKYKGYCIKLTNNNSPIILILQQENFHLVINNDNSIDLIYYNIYRSSPEYIKSAILDRGYLACIRNYRKNLNIGNTDILTLVNDLNDLLNSIDISVESTTIVPKKEGKLLFSCPYPFIIDGKTGTLTENLGFDTYPGIYVNGTSFQAEIVGTNEQLFLSRYDTVNSRWNVISPGLVNLLGERFVLLRIPELEDHIYGSYTYMEFTPGIGMFKMGATGGAITNLRFDFTTLVKKPFHPIGRLSKLTFRWETKDGRIYDFKGVNHQLLFAIKYYTYGKNVKFDNNIINPNYNPDLIEYMAKNKCIEYREDSDDEQEFNEVDYIREYKKLMAKYDYETESNLSSYYSDNESNVSE
jgi:hypothetical protein